MEQEILKTQGVVSIPSSDDAHNRLGLGTLALEFLEQMKGMDQ